MKTRLSSDSFPWQIVKLSVFASDWHYTVERPYFYIHMNEWSLSPLVSKFTHKTITETSKKWLINLVLRSFVIVGTNMWSHCTWQLPCTVPLERDTLWCRIWCRPACCPVQHSLQQRGPPLASTLRHRRHQTNGKYLVFCLLDPGWGCLLLPFVQTWTSALEDGCVYTPIVIIKPIICQEIDEETTEGL